MLAAGAKNAAAGAAAAAGGSGGSTAAVMSSQQQQQQRAGLLLLGTDPLAAPRTAVTPAAVAATEVYAWARGTTGAVSTQIDSD